MKMTERTLFNCKECGGCCHGDTTVSLGPEDLERLLAFLNLSYDEAVERYLRVSGNCIQMQTVDGHCIFYNRGCLVHRAKPARCREWPLHKSILLDANNLETIRSSCPGISRQLAYEDFCALLSKLRRP